MKAPGCSMAYFILLLLGVFFELMAMFSALVVFRFIGVIASILFFLFSCTKICFSLQIAKERMDFVGKKVEKCGRGRGMGGRSGFRAVRRRG